MVDKTKNLKDETPKKVEWKGRTPNQEAVANNGALNSVTVIMQRVRDWIALLNPQHPDQTDPKKTA